jgi:PAS domain S-box-containing protein
MASLPEFRENLFPDSIRGRPRLGEVPGLKKAENLKAEPGLAASNLPPADQREQLPKSEEGFVKAFRSNPLAISIASQPEGRYIDVNDAFLEMLGYGREQVIGRTAEELEFWAVKEDEHKVTEELIEAGRVKRLPITFRTSSGEMREANLSAELIDVDGLPCVLAITQDVTETKRLEDQVRQAQKLEAIGRLAGSIAHDFNNMLSVIMGYSDLSLQNLSSTDPVAKNVVQIKNAAERAASFIRRLLAFSRQQLHYPRILDLNVVIQNLSQMIPRMIGEDITLTVRPAASPIYVEADLGHLEQILMNLVVNSRDAMPLGGELIIETAQADLDNPYVDRHASVEPGRYAVLSVSDTGCGMDDHVLAHIFEPFFTTKAPGQGTGLGLSTVLGIVKQSQGRIFVRSECGVGTTFKIYFPRIEEKSDIEPKPLAEPVSPSASETILLAEDDDALRKLLVTMLESVGYRVLPAGDPRFALELFDKHSPHISMLLSDCVMPEMSGNELASQLRSRRPDLKVLLMSGYAPDLVLPHAVSEWGAVLTKPFTRNALLDTVRSVLSLPVGYNGSAPANHPRTGP